MNHQNSSWETTVHQTAVSFTYPPTPSVTAAVRRRLAAPPPRRSRRQLAYAAVALLVLAILLAVPPVRAALVSIFRAGAITIFVHEPTATSLSPTPSSPTSSSPTPLSATPTQPTPSSPAGALIPATATPMPPPLETAVYELAGRTTLEEALAQVGFPLLIPPAYGRPDEVYLQTMPDPGLGGQVVIMVWFDPTLSEQVRLRLFQIDLDRYALKHASAEAVTITEVNGQPAYWIEGGHLIQLQDEGGGELFFTADSVLVWSDGDVSYRLDGRPTLEEAARIAGMLVPADALELPGPSPISAPYPAGVKAAETCPVTRPPDPPYIPPQPWPSRPPVMDQFWFGEDGLWTALPNDGSWRQLALGEKFWWWSEDFDVYEDATPDLTVTARRLDEAAPSFQVSEATNGFHESFNWAMLIGVKLGAPGCWEFVGQYKGHHVSVVLWVPPE